VGEVGFVGFRASGIHMRSELFNRRNKPKRRIADTIGGMIVLACRKISSLNL